MWWKYVSAGGRWPIRGSESRSANSEEERSALVIEFGLSWIRSLPELVTRTFVCTFVAVFTLHASWNLLAQGVAQAMARRRVRL